MSKILFSNPPWLVAQDGRLRTGIRAGSRWPFTRWANHQPDNFKFGGYLPFPFFLAHAASHTKMLMPDADVQIRDSIARGESYEAFTKWMVSYKPDWVVVETATPSLDHDLNMIMGMPASVILCGPIDEAKHRDIFERHPNVHSIVKGEFDKQIAKAILSPRGTVLEHDLLTTAEMNFAPPPMWDEACATHYWDGCPEGQVAPQLQMWTSRGCPRKCCFCVWPAVMTGNDPDGTKPRSVRFYSPEYVEKHIRSRLAQHDYKSIYLDDDTLNLADGHTLRVSEVMKRVGLPWSAMCRADMIKRETWRSMRDSGCFGVKIGFESGSQYVLDHIVNKQLDIAKAVETCIFLQKELGLKVHTTWTVGLPGETPEQQQETLDLIERMYQIGAHTTNQLSGTATIEGTPLSRIARGEHLDKYDGAVMSPDFKVMGDGQAKIESMAK